MVKLFYNNYIHALSIILFLFISIFSQPTQAEFGVAIGYGLNSSLNAYRFAFQASTFSCCELGFVWPMSGFLELGLNKMACRNALVCNNCNHSNTCNNCNDTLYGADLNHTFRFTQDNFSPCIFPYVEFAPGIASFNKKDICNLNLGAESLFELKFGVGFRFGRQREYDLSYKYFRYSNGIHIFNKSSHDVININSIMLNFWFY